MMDLVWNHRQIYILEKLETDKKVLVASLAQELEVAPETIRRDLDGLEKEKKVTRVHGGAVLYMQTNNEPHFIKKMNVMADEKVSIGRKAAGFIRDGDTIMIDVGTTTIHLAKVIAGVKALTVVTNSLAVAEELNIRLENHEFEGRVIMLGGITNPTQKSVVGALTCKLLETFRFDKLFLSCGGVTMSYVSDYDFEECLVSQAMVERANQVFLLADSSKIDQEAFSKICPLETIDFIISDKDMPAVWKKQNLDALIQWVSTEGGVADES